MSRNLNDRVLAELGRAPTRGVTRGELVILMLDVDDDLVTEALDQLHASGQVVTTTCAGPFRRCLKHHPNAAAGPTRGASAPPRP